MAFEGLDWQVVNVPFGAGLFQKTDQRARPQPYLDIASDIQFDEQGGVQPRLPFAASAGSIFGGGTITNARRIERNGTETVLFTDTQVYSWNAQLSKWVLRGTHLAVAVDEMPRFVTTGDQIDPDRAELSGTVVYAWTEATTVYAAAIDKTTGSVLMSPTVVSSAVGRPRLVATATAIFLFTDSGASGLIVRILDPAAPATGIATAGLSITAGTIADTLGSYYDVVRAGTQDAVIGAYRRSVTTSYTVFRITAAGSVTKVTKARVCDGPIALATIPDGTQTQIIRTNTTNIQGDLLTTSTLADVFTGQAIGTATSTTINQVTVAFATTTSARAFWTSGTIGETASFTDFTVKTNTVTVANAVGSQATFRHHLGIASRAFGYDGHVYVWLAFGQDSGTSALGNVSAVRAQLQNSYFLYRDDITVVSRCTHNVGGGYASSTGRLPGVALVDGATGFAWCATSRRRIELGGDAEHTGYSARSPRDVTFTFDSNAARRCARLGNTLYVTGGIPMQYDGVGVFEVGFLTYPWYFEPQLGAAGNLGAGTYTWKSTLKWQNAQGEVERSTTATGMDLTIAASKFVFLNYMFLNVTLKVAPRPVELEFWRTAVNPDTDVPFFKVSSQDPNAGIVDNGYIANDDTSASNTPLPDNFADATLITKEENPENGAVLENLAPPGAKIIFATETRLFLLGVAGDPDRGWYSKLRGANEVAAFHDTLTFDVPHAGGTITSGWFDDNGILYVARQTALYAFSGAGKDNLGQGANYQLSRIVADDIGVVNHESVARTPKGVIFKSSKGWQLLLANGDLEFIGDKVSDFDAETVLSVVVVETQHQVRILTASRMLVWDYRAGQWGPWTVTDGVHACMANGAHVYLTATGTRTQLTTYTTPDYALDVEETFLKLADLQGASRCRSFQVLGELRSACAVRVRVAYNYVSTYIDDKTWIVTPATVGAPLQIKHRPKRPICESIKVRLTVGALAQLHTTDLTIPLALIGTAPTWNAILVASTTVTIALSIVGAEVAGDPTVEVRDNQVFDGTQWFASPGHVGIGIVGGTGPTVAALETAIGRSQLVRVSTPHATPADLVDISAIDTIETTGAFTPQALGEGVKLTGIGYEVANEKGLFRLPRAQQQ